MINTVNKSISGWEIRILDNGTTGRNKPNPNKLNFLSNDKTCKVNGCENQINIRRTSGLCDDHIEHEHDLLLELRNHGNLIGVPSHQDIIDALMDWSSSRNFGLLPFFSSLSFNTLGNVPDVSSLAGKTTHKGITPITIDFIFDELIKVVNNFFPINNNSSYQPLNTSRGEIPAIVLAFTFAGLLICEESNRGDRWFSRVIRKDESRTTQLGAAMPIAYFATRIFPWGVEMKNSARNLTR
ncbi:hypothetical protein JBL43_09085 [Aureibaculum sp. A20]|uniref:Uncharacterized protein n=1 Tax=Aureibaculum flavum TaxID=2795986 RepID=A0ABS0WQX5_9FLAO|nr:hypothetical protein [Aureibaculum flavum]MBJ2174389.1 hypothetical protein [Aureibaculum flavum]